MNSRRNCDLPSPPTFRPATCRSSLLPSSIQLLRCTAEAVRRRESQALQPSQRSAGRWASGEAHGSGDQPGDPDTRRRFGGTSLRTVGQIAVLDPGSREGPRDLFVVGGSTHRRSGGDEETRTPDPLLAKEMLCQLSYVPVTFALCEVVGAPGLEPGTSALSGPRSNQLSYAP